MVKAIKAAVVTARDNPPHPTWQWIFTTTIVLVAGVLGYLAVTLTSVQIQVGVSAAVLESLEEKFDQHGHAE